MNILVTAGNTQTPIDRVRCLTNIFTGRTGTQIALEAHRRGHDVALLTSHPEVVADLPHEGQDMTRRWGVRPYRTFEDLQTLLRAAVCQTPPDVIVHSAAVSDFAAAGVLAPDAATLYDPATRTWHGPPGQPPRMADRAAGKVKSDTPELWIRLVRAPKLVDAVRSEWGFQGLLVKFKLEVGVTDRQLLDVAERSRRHSAADLMVANSLEDASRWAFLGPVGGGYRKVSRPELAPQLLAEIERLATGKGHG